GDRCPFLNEKNLCDIILTKGENMLCEICQNHPRFFNVFDNYTQQGIGLCCEEACRLLFSTSDALTFNVNDDGKNIKTENSALENILYSALQTMIEIVQDRSNSFYERVVELLDFSADLQFKLYSEEEVELKDLDKYSISQQTLDIFGKTEYINDSWKDMFYELKNKLSVIYNNEEFNAFMVKSIYQYEHLLIYMLYRHFLNCVYDGEILTRIKFCLINLWLVYIMDVLKWVKSNNYTMIERIEITKLWSKQIEYSDDNVDFLLHQCMQNCNLSVNNIKKLFCSIK
ncbi:MAG: flagellin lysine-N-methylase, partial [Oscillospiraceae bacterium]